MILLWKERLKIKLNVRSKIVITIKTACARPKVLNDKSQLWLLNFVFNGALFGNDQLGLGNKNPLVYPEFKLAEK